MRHGFTTILLDLCTSCQMFGPGNGSHSKTALMIVLAPDYCPIGRSRKSRTRAGAADLREFSCESP